MMEVSPRNFAPKKSAGATSAAENKIVDTLIKRAGDKLTWVTTLGHALGFKYTTLYVNQ